VWFCDRAPGGAEGRKHEQVSEEEKSAAAPATIAITPVLSLGNLYDRPLGRPEDWYTTKGRLKSKPYEHELAQLQLELVKLQEWVRAEKRKVVVIFEGRDAAGKGGAIKRVVEKLNPRVCRIAALPVPTEREQTQWYFQRYVAHLPSGGEIVLFDRSWYNRALVERVMGFCSERITRSSPARCRSSNACWCVPGPR